MATSFRFRGRTSSVPRAETDINTDALQGAPTLARGIVAVIGDGVGVRPATSDLTPDEFPFASNEVALRRLVTSGGLLNAGLLLFDPADQDPVIQGGAQALYLMNTNSAAKATGYLLAGLNRVVALTSVAYGVSANQINTSVAINGNARSITVIEGDITEGFSGGAGQEQFTAAYAPGTLLAKKGWDDVAMAVHTDAIRAFGTKTNNTLIADLDTGGSACGTTIIKVTPNLVSLNGPLTLTVYGRTTADVPTRTVFSFAAGATTAQPSNAGATNFILAAVSSRALESGETLDVADSTTAANGLATMVSGDYAKGCVVPRNMWMGNGQLGYKFSATGCKAIVWGKNASGGDDWEFLPGLATFVSNVYQHSTKSWSKIEVVVLSEVATAASMQTAGFAAVSSDASIPTVSGAMLVFKSEDQLGFEMTLVRRAAFSSANLDIATDTGTSLSVTTPFYSKLQDVVNGINTGSGLETAARTTFTPQKYTVSAVEAATGTWTLTIAGQTVQYASTFPATVPVILAELAARWNVSPVASQRFSAAIVGANLVLTGRTTTGVTVIAAATGAGNSLSASATVPDPIDAPLPPDATSSPVFLVNGSDGVSDVAAYSTVLTLLEGITVNAILCLSMDPAVHALVKAHVLKMQDRRAYLGLSALDGENLPTGELPTKSSVLAQARALNCPFISVFAQAGDVTGPDGVQARMGTPFVAAVDCGMEMAAPSGEATTNKRAKITKLYQDVSWSPVVDADDMINGGVTICRDLRTKGFRWVRGVSTWLVDNNLAKTEASVNRVQTLLYIRTQEFSSEIPGRRGSPVLLGQLKHGYSRMVDQAVADGDLVSWAPSTLVLTLTGDLFTATFKGIPPVAINFSLTEIIFELPVFVG